MTTTFMTRTGRSRPGTLIAAIVLLLIGALANIATLPFVPSEDRATIIAVSSVLSSLRLVGAAGLWQGLRWAAILAFVVTLVDGLLSAPGIAFADGTTWKVFSAVALLHAIAVCWLLLKDTTRAALQ